MFVCARPAKLLALVVSVVVLGVCPSMSSASLVIEVADAAVAPGGTATVDVTISSTLPGGEPLSNFGFEFLISTAGPTQLDFVDPQSDSQLTQANYVLFGNSLAEAIPPVGTVGITIVPNDTFVGGDGTADFSDVTVPASGLLLARLNLTTLTLLPPQLGDTFSIALLTGVNTFFGDSEENPIGFSSLAGTVTVVPEPLTFGLLISGLPWLAVRLRRRY